jgi:hypothetical protein
MEEWADSRWSFVSSIPFVWLQKLYSQLPRNKFPILSGPTLVACTDTSGAQRGSRYIVAGVLIVDIENSGNWNRDRMRIRNNFLRNNRRMSYKNMNDGQRRAALMPFLRAADDIRGLCFVMAFDKRLGNLCTCEGLYDRAKREGIIKGRWKASNFDQMMRMVQLVSSLLASVATRGQHIFWISDLDDCFSTELMKADTAAMMSSFTSQYIKHELGELGLGTTELDEGDRFEEDLAAIPDLAAGAVCDLLNEMHQHFGMVPQIRTLVPRLRPKTDAITSWFFDNRGSLIKLAGFARFVPGRGMQVGCFRTEDQGDIMILEQGDIS